MWPYMVHLASATFLAYAHFIARDSDLELSAGLVLVVVNGGLAAYIRRTPQYAVFKARRRAKPLRNKRVALQVPIEGVTSRRTMRVEGRVVWVSEVYSDAVIVQTDSAVSTTTGRSSDLLAIVPAEPGDLFVNLLEQGTMRVRILLVDRIYLSAARGNPLARAPNRRRKVLDIGTGVASLERA